MRYRALSLTGDYTFGFGQANLLINSPAAVAQAILTRLKLFTTEWFLDQTAGTPWKTQVLGKNTGNTYDTAIKNRVLGTEGVVSIIPGSYSSVLNRAARTLTVQMQVLTIYSTTPIFVSTVL